MSGSQILATGAGSYLHWGVIQISVANLIVIGVMVALFVLALVVPFPGHRGGRRPEDRR